MRHASVKEAIKLIVHDANPVANIRNTAYGIDSIDWDTSIMIFWLGQGYHRRLSDQ